MAYKQGSIVLADNPYADGLRPMMVVSNDERPYQGKQYTFAVISRADRDKAVRLESGDLTEGGLDRYPSFVNPWSLHEIEHTDVRARVGQVADDVFERVADGITRFHEPKAD